MMNRIVCLMLIFGVVAFGTSTVPAASINVDFGPNDNTNSGVYIGTAVAADSGSYWNALQPGTSYPTLTETSFTSSYLLDSLGNSTGITVTAMPSFFLYDEGLAQSGTNSFIAPELMHDYMFTPTAGGGTSYTFSIDGLDTTKTYDLFLYSDTGVQRTDFNIGGVVKKVVNPGTAQSSWGLGANYQVFSDVSAAGGSIMVTVSGSPGPNYGVTNGFQLIESSGPIVWTPATGSDNFEVATNWTPNAVTDRSFFISGTVPAQLAVESSYVPRTLTIASTADGQLNINNGGRLTVADTLVLSPNTSKATLNLTGDAQLTVGQLQANGVAYGSGKTSISLSGTSQLTVNAATTYLSGYGQTCITLKDHSTMSAAQTGYFSFGEDNGVGSPAQSNGAGILTVQDDATLTLGTTALGNSGTAGAMRVTGGTVNMNGTGDVKHFGMWDGGYGLLEVTGGTVNATRDSTYLVSLCIGSRGAMYGELYTHGTPTYCNPPPRGLLSVSGTGTVDSSGGLVTVNPGSTINIGVVGSPSGTLLAAGILPMELDFGGDVNFHGGTFKASTPVLPDSPPWNEVVISNIYANVYAEGAVIDTNSQTVRIYNSLIAPAGFGITAIPVADGGSGYTVAPIVRLTTFVGTGSGANAVAVLDGSGHVDHIQITNPGTNYSAGELIQVDLLGGDGTGAYASLLTLADSTTDPVNFNIAANVSGGLTKLNAGTLILGRNLTYTGPTDIQAGTVELIYTEEPLNLPGGITSSTGAGSLTVYDGVSLTTPSIVVDTLTIGGAVPALSAVPEPSTLLLLLIAATTATWAAPRRK